MFSTEFQGLENTSALNCYFGNVSSKSLLSLSQPQSHILALFSLFAKFGRTLTFQSNVLPNNTGWGAIQLTGENPCISLDPPERTCPRAPRGDQLQDPLQIPECGDAQALSRQQPGSMRTLAHRIHRLPVSGQKQMRCSLTPSMCKWTYTGCAHAV